MDFSLSEEQKMILQTAREFAAREIAPRAAELDKTSHWPQDIVNQLAELGFMGVAVPEAYGGAGLDALCYAIAMEEISAACASCGVIMSVNNSLFCDPLYKFGTDDQKKNILTPVAGGKKLGCFGLTEPMSGSDAQTMSTHAVKVSDGWVISGAKNWITNGPHADYILVFAVTDRVEAPGKPPRVKHTAFVVPRGTPGYTQNARDHKLGIHAAHSCTVFFENCHVPDSAVVGQVGEGFKVAMATLDGGRIGIAAQALGIGRAALETSLGYAKVRVACKPRVNILATGDELVKIDDSLRDGQIRNSTSYVLASYVEQAGCEAEILGIVPDKKKKLRKAIKRAFDCNILLITGGVSVGKYDLVRDVLESVGVKIKFWRVNIRPGKPLLFGTFGRTLVFGLPGNPVSTSVGFLQFVRPAIHKMLGSVSAAPFQLNAILDEPITKHDGKRHFVRGVATNKNEQLRVRTTGTQSSGALSSVAKANCFIIISEKSPSLKKGSKVLVEMI
jgi:butyryl-CoA dehydrogenase